jgi:hypothetical protein
VVVESRDRGEGSRSSSQYLYNGKNAVQQGDEGDHGNMGSWEDGNMKGNQGAGDAGDAGDARGRIEKGTIGILD